MVYLQSHSAYLIDIINVSERAKDTREVLVHISASLPNPGCTHCLTSVQLHTDVTSLPRLLVGLTMQRRVCHAIHDLEYKAVILRWS